MHPLPAAVRRGLVVVLVSLVTGLLSAATSGAPAAKEYFVYFGTYTKAKSKGIYRARLDAASGKLSAAELAAETGDPAFLAVHPNGRFLYAIDERTDPQKTPGRGVSAFAIEPGGRLTLLNQQEVGGPGPCHLSVDTSGRSVIVANYGGGSVAALGLQPDGRLGARGSFVQHQGASVHPTRQTAPHAHAAMLSPDDRIVLVPDLGLDRVQIYRLDAARAGLTANTPAFAALPPGSGPRHLAFRADGKFVYVINELLCTMAVFAYDAARGELTPVQTVSTLPPGETVQQGFSTAEVIAHPSGKFLYGSNRGHNSIVAYAVDAGSGRLTHLENEPTQGQTPRHFAIDPTGRWLLAENQGSDTVVVFRVDPATGKLEPTGQKIDVPVPVCAVFVAAR